MSRILSHAFTVQRQPRSWFADDFKFRCYHEEELNRVWQNRAAAIGFCTCTLGMVLMYAALKSTGVAP